MKLFNQLILDGDTLIFNPLWGVRKVSSKKQDIEAVVPPLDYLGDPI
jgi:hypothetical protein